MLRPKLYFLLVSSGLIKNIENEVFTSLGLPAIGLYLAKTGLFLPKVGVFMAQFNQAVPHVGLSVLSIGQFVPMVGQYVPHLAVLVLSFVLFMPRFKQLSTQVSQPKAGIAVYVSQTVLFFDIQMG